MRFSAKRSRGDSPSTPLGSTMGHTEPTTAAHLKIDFAFTRDIDQNSAHQTLVKTLCEIGHSIGVTMIAEGVRNDSECNTLRKLGADGVTGPGVSSREPQVSWMTS